MISCEFVCGCSSVVERQLPKLNVAGSSPVTRFGRQITYRSLVSELALVEWSGSASLKKSSSYHFGYGDRTGPDQHLRILFNLTFRPFVSRAIACTNPAARRLFGSTARTIFWACTAATRAAGLTTGGRRMVGRPPPHAESDPQGGSSGAGHLRTRAGLPAFRPDLLRQERPRETGGRSPAALARDHACGVVGAWYVLGLLE